MSHASSAARAYEDRLHTTIHARLPPEVRERLDALLQPPPAGIEADGEDDPTAVTGARALLNFVRGDPGRAGVASVARGLERLEAIRAVGLPASLFAGVLPHEVELCRRRVAVQPPSDLRRLPEPARLAKQYETEFARSRQRQSAPDRCTGGRTKSTRQRDDQAELERDRNDERQDDPAKVVNHDAHIQQHADRHKEQAEQHIAKRFDVFFDSVLEFRFGDQHASDERPECQ